MNAQLPQQLLSLGLLAQLEHDVRLADDAMSLAFMCVNDTHKIVPYDHALIWRPGPGVTAVSGGVAVEQSQPQIRFFDRLAAVLSDGAAAHSVHRLQTESLSGSLRDEAGRWIKAECVRMPLLGPRNRLEGALFLLRTQPFGDAEMRVLARLGSAFGSAFVALTATVQGRTWRGLPRSRVGIALAAGLIAVSLVPVQLTVLADAKVAPLVPRIVSAPIDGVIKDVRVRPNQEVSAGMLLWSFDDTELRATRSISEKRVLVLKAEHARAEQSGFRDAKARAELTLLASKLAEGEAELAYALDRLARTEVRAPDNGILMFDDPVSWVGRPVKVGERVMSVADPAQVRLEISLAVDDALVVQSGSNVDFFMAVAPNDPVAARMTRVSYDAKLSATQTVAFAAEAEFTGGIEPPRIGLTGTAKVYGARVSLFYALLRKPLASLRRLTGY